jgi:3'(2'), 5'-bisphosphate nucleotidase
MQLHTREPRDGALVAFESRSHRTDEDDAFLARLGITDARPLSSSLKFCRIAQGKADCYARMGPTSEWDTAAGHAILAAAGGAVTTRDGAPLRYGKAELGYLNPSFVAWGRLPLAARAGSSASR